MMIAHDQRETSRLSEPVINLYFNCFLLVLAGYATLGKGFAYIGVGQFYIGEFALAAGCLVTLITGTLGIILKSGPAITLLLLAAWTACRTIPFLSAYGLEALRDSVIVFYCAFAFIIASILVQNVNRLSQLIAHYNRFVPYLIGILAIIAIYVAIFSNRDQVDAADQSARWFGFKPGDALVQMTGILLFAALKFRRLGWTLGCGLFLIVAIGTSLSRGGLVALSLAMMVALWTMKKEPEVRKIVSRMAVTLVIAAFVLVCFDINISTGREGRDISARQFVTNLVSIVTDANSGDVQGTKEFREEWWSAIIGYTVHGPYFWTGKGFGVNLATSDGFQLIDERSGLPQLRSPHNAFMTVLARMGVPGFVLWTIALATWCFHMVAAIHRTRIAGDLVWNRFFSLVFCWWIAFLVNATFDVSLEGPVDGIWFWSLHGIGIAAGIGYRASSERSTRKCA